MTEKSHDHSASQVRAESHKSRDENSENSKTLPKTTSAAGRLNGTPHVVLVTETAALHGAFPLILHLAQLEAERAAPVLVVDLAPAASRLVHGLGHPASRLAHWRGNIQPFWIDSTHGRTLNNWNRAGGVDLIAQLDGEFPDSSQMPRLCEQLVRQLAQPRPQTDGEPVVNYQQVFLLSECVGVPLDRAAWQAADEIWVMHDPKQPLETVAAHLATRIGKEPRGSAQRLVLLNKVLPKLGGLAQGRRIVAARHPAAALNGNWPHVEAYDLSWPILSARLSMTLARAARDVSRHVLHSEVGGSLYRRGSHQSGAHPSGAHPSGAHPSGAHPSGAHRSGAHRSEPNRQAG